MRVTRFALRHLNVGTLIPLTLALTVLTEIGLRRVPLERFAFRSLEALRGTDPEGGPFLPNRRYRNSGTYGDLAGLGNLRSLRQYRVEDFTTDRWGYRNLAPTLVGPHRAILVGDSFGIAPGMEDRHTLSAQLERRWGCSVYNASGMSWGIAPGRVREVAGRLGMRGGVVIHQFLERQDIPAVPRAAQRLTTPSRQVAASLPDSVIHRAAAWWGVSRLRILAKQAYRIAEDDRVLPNPYRSHVTVKQLVNGRSMLFLPSDLESRTHHRPVSAAYWSWLQQELSKDGFSLVVLLVPNKYTVYSPLLIPPGSDADPGADHLDRLEESLRRASVPVVNLTSLYRTRAAQGLQRGIYLYWLDDTHWTPEGIGIAAKELARLISGSAAQAERTRSGFGRPHECDDPGDSLPSAGSSGRDAEPRIARPAAIVTRASRGSG